jgi:hydroxymethylpyrimidine/phosphomethylpyrimidine kinase
MTVRTALTIAGSDPSGGAGIQGDLRTFAAFGVHGFSVLTSVIAQGSRGVRRVFPLDAEQVRAQLAVVLEDFTIDAVKLGALATEANVRVVADLLRGRSSATAATPLVIDPVITSSSGAALLDDDGVRGLVEGLFPYAALVTPNAPEIARLLEDAQPPKDADALSNAAHRLHARTGAAVLAKGGHLDGSPVDVLIDRDGHEHRFSQRRIDSPATRGTGCTLASAIAAGLAHGAPLRAAIEAALSFLHDALVAGVALGPGESPVAQLHRGAPPLR